MAYRRPGTYARFVKTASPVVNAGGSRILGLVGTGINYFTVYNEAVLKSKTQPYDELMHNNVFEILNVSSRPIYDNIITDNTIIYNKHTDTQRGYTINDNIITWDYLVAAKVEGDYSTCPAFYNKGKNIEVSIDENAQFPVVDGKWIIEVSYINEDDDSNDPKLGCYRIINGDTSEIIGEYVVSDKPVTNEDGTYPIPGIQLIVRDTYLPVSFIDKTLTVNVGDYVTIITTAAKTEREALAYKQKTTGVVKNLGWKTCEGTPDEEGKIVGITTDWEAVTGDDGSYILYIKTDEFEGNKVNPPIYTENAPNVYSIRIDGLTEYDVTKTDIEDLTGYTEAFNKEFNFTTTIAEKQTTEEPEESYTSKVKVVIDDYNKDYNYYYCIVDSETGYTFSEADMEPLTRKTTTISIDEADKNKYICFGVYSIASTEDDITTYWNHYADNNKVVAIASDIDTKTTTTVVAIEGTEKPESADTVVTKFNATMYNADTFFYLMLTALDENDNPIDFVYGSVPGVSDSSITNEGESVVGTNYVNSLGVTMANDESYVATITSSTTLPVERSTTPSATTKQKLYDAITNISVISDTTLNQTSSVYRLTVVEKTTDNDTTEKKLRITRYVDGVLDESFVDYAGIITPPENDESETYRRDNYSEEMQDYLMAMYRYDGTEGDFYNAHFYTEDGSKLVGFNEESANWYNGDKSDNKVPKNIYNLASFDYEMFDIIPGVTFNFNMDELVNIAAGSDIFIITSPRVTSEEIPSEGDTYYVSYKYRKSDADYDPIFFTDYDDIVATYGNYDVSASSAVMNSISLGAEIAFNNGVSQIVCCQAKNNSSYEMQAAIDRMQKEVAGAPNIATIIPLTTDNTVGAYLQKHVNTMSSYDYGKERMGYLGASIGQKINKIATKDDRTVGMTTVAEGYDDERIVYVVPGAARKQIRDLRTGKYNTRVLPGCYLAVAVASLGLSQDPAEPLTNKNIVGFTELVDLYSENEKNILAQAGCCVLEHSGQNIRIRHGITTNNDEVNSQEITLIQIKDYVIDGCRTVTRDTYIGRKLTASIIADIRYTMESLLNNYVSGGIIINYSSLKVKRNVNEPRQIDVSFEIEAVYPLNWISIEFGFSAVQ